MGRLQLTWFMMSTILVIGIHGYKLGDSFACNAHDCYFAVNESLGHVEAATCCSVANGYLATIKDASEEIKVSRLIRRQKWNEEVWIGAKLVPMLWHWETGGQFLFRQGCYKVTERQDRTLSDSNITLADCIDACAQNNYPLASMSSTKRGSERIFNCYCNQMDDTSNWQESKELTKPEEKCSTPCKDDENEKCGGERPFVRYLYFINGTKWGQWTMDCQWCEDSLRNGNLEFNPGDRPEDQGFRGPRPDRTPFMLPGPNPESGRQPGEGTGDDFGRSPPDRRGGFPGSGGRGGPDPGGPDQGGPGRGDSRLGSKQRPLPGKPWPKLCSAIVIVNRPRAGQPRVIYVPEDCSSKKKYICQYKPITTGNCRDSHKWLERSQLCAFEVKTGAKSTEGLKTCQSEYSQAYPLEVTSEEILADLLQNDNKRKQTMYRMYWSGLTKWELTWPESNYKGTYTDWASSKPEGDISKLCIAVSGQDNQWHNRDCHRPQKFVCQIPKEDANSLIEQQIKNPCEARLQVAAAVGSGFKQDLLIPVVASSAGAIVIAIIFAFVCARVRKNKKDKTDSQKGEGKANSAYGTVFSTDDKEEVYDVINEEGINYASLIGDPRYGGPPEATEDQYRRLTTSSDTSMGADSEKELTKHEAALPESETCVGPNLPPRDPRYTKLGSVNLAQEKENDEVFESPEDSTAKKPVLPPNDSQESTKDNAMSQEVEPPTSSKDETTEDSNDYSSNDYLKIIG